MSVPAVRFDAVQKRYASGTQALRGVSFDVEEGEFFGLLGPNGAGKTTLITCLAGLATPTGGRIFVRGMDVRENRRAASLSLGIVPQEITFDPFLTVRETLRFQSGYWGIRNNDDWNDEILSNLGLSDKADASMRALSGGMKRRVLVAQALVHKPPVIVLDEPTAGVDVELREHLWDFIGRLHGEGRTIILTTHYLAEAQSLCGRIAIMKKGEVAALDRTEALLSRFDGRVLRCRIVEGECPKSLEGDLMRRHGADIALRLADADDALAKLEALRAAGVRIENLTVGQPDLEDVFLALTGADQMWIPFRTLFLKEVVRFMKVWLHTILAPVLTGGLYLVVFGEALSKHLPVYEGVSYTAFIIPGLIMMTVLQNAFSNTASSFIQSKISGNLVFILLPSIPGPAVAAAYICASFVRSMLAGAGLYLFCALWAAPPVKEPLLILSFAFFGSMIMASLGLITALWAEKYDQMGAVMNFVVMPLTFLSGVFYSVESLPPVWQAASKLNPFFYLVDGFRSGFFGTGDINPWGSLVIVGVTALAAMALAVILLTKGWKIRN